MLVATGVPSIVTLKKPPPVSGRVNISIRLPVNVHVMVLLAAPLQTCWPVEFRLVFLPDANSAQSGLPLHWVTIPSSGMPALSHFWIRWIMRESLIQCFRKRISQTWLTVWLTVSKYDRMSASREFPHDVNGVLNVELFQRP